MTMAVYAHWVQQREENSLAAKAEALLVAEAEARNGCCAFRGFTEAHATR
jgi:hypothetical protein